MVFWNSKWRRRNPKVVRKISEFSDPVSGLKSRILIISGFFFSLLKPDLLYGWWSLKSFGFSSQYLLTLEASMRYGIKLILQRNNRLSLPSYFIIFSPSVENALWRECYQRRIIVEGETRNSAITLSVKKKSAESD